MEAIDLRGDTSIFLIDRQHHVTAAAGGLHRRYGYDFEMLRGRRAEVLVGASVRRQMVQCCDAALSGEASVIDVVMSAGSDVCEASFGPLMRAGDIVGGTITVRDVSEHRSTQRALQECSAALDALIDGSDTACGLLAPSGAWARVNDATVALLGYEVDVLRASSIVDLAHPQDRLELSRALNGLEHDARDRCVLTVRLGQPAGRFVAMSVRLTAVRADRRTRGLVAQIRPIVQDPVFEC